MLLLSYANTSCSLNPFRREAVEGKRCQTTSARLRHLTNAMTHCSSARARREARQEKVRKAREKKQARGGARRHRRQDSTGSRRRGDDGEADDEEAALRQAQYAQGIMLPGRTGGAATSPVPGQADLVEGPAAHVRFASAPQSTHGEDSDNAEAAAQIDSRNRYADRSGGQRRPGQSRSRSASFLSELPRWMPGSGSVDGRPSLGLQQRTSPFSESFANLGNSVRDRIASSVPDGKFSKLRFW